MAPLILQLNCKAATPVKADRCAHFSPASYKGRSAPMQSTSQIVTICASATRQSDPFQAHARKSLALYSGGIRRSARCGQSGAAAIADRLAHGGPSLAIRSIFAARHVLVHIRLRASRPVAVNPVPPFPTLPSGMNRTVQYHWPSCCRRLCRGARAARRKDRARSSRPARSRR